MAASARSAPQWLARTLDEMPDTPTVLALHHPPVPSGIVWMDEPPGAPWLARLEDVIKGRRQIKTHHLRPCAPRL